MLLLLLALFSAWVAMTMWLQPWLGWWGRMSSPPSQLLHVDKLTTKLGALKKGGRRAAPRLASFLPRFLPSSAASVTTFHLERTMPLGSSQSHQIVRGGEQASLVARHDAGRSNERGNLIFERSSAWHPWSTWRPTSQKRLKSSLFLRSFYFGPDGIGVV